MAILPGNRIRKNGVFGNITDNPLLIAATTFNSAGLSSLPVVSGNHAIITLDPLKQFGNPEIVMVTVHTAAATVATITRGMFGTVARQHPVNTLWVHAATQDDFVEDLTSSTRPSDQYRGQHIYESDTNRYVGYSSANAWQQMGLFFDPPACRVFRSTPQTGVLSFAATPVLFDSERYDTDNMHSTVSNTGRITFNTAGLYTLTGNIQYGVNATGFRGLFIYINGGPTRIASEFRTANNGDVTEIAVATTYKFAVNDYVELIAYQTSGSTLTLGVFGNAMPEFTATWIGRGN